jgi:hypothetical protein
VTSKNGISARATIAAAATPSAISATAIAAAAIAALTLFSSAGYAQSNLPWTGTWSVAAQQTTIDASFNNLTQQTLRQILHTSIGGTAARVQISNAFQHLLSLSLARTIFEPVARHRRITLSQRGMTRQRHFRPSDAESDTVGRASYDGRFGKWRVGERCRTAAQNQDLFMRWIHLALVGLKHEPP